MFNVQSAVANAATFHLPFKTPSVIPVIALTGVTTEGTMSLLRIMAIAALKVRGARIAPLSHITKVDTAPAMEVVRALGADPKLFHNLVSNILLAQTVENAKAFAQNLRAAWKNKNAKNDLVSFNSSQSNIFNPLTAVMMNPEREASYNLLQKNIGILKEPALTRMFAATTSEHLGDPNEIQDRVKALVKKLTGKTGVSIGKEDLSNLAADPKKTHDLKEYKKAAADFKVSLGSHIKEIVGDTGKTHAPLKDISAELKKRGLPNPFHPGLQNQKTVHSDLDSNFTDAAGNKLVNGINNPNHELSVVMNPSYDPNSKLDKDEHGSNYLYKYMYPKDAKYGARAGKKFGSPAMPANKTGGRKKATFEAVERVAKNIDAVKAKWRKQFGAGSGIEDERRVFPYMAELLYWTGMRVGSSQNNRTVDRQTKKEIDTYGAALIEVKQTKIAGDKVTFDYPGKDNVVQHYVISPDMPNGPSDLDLSNLSKLTKFIAAKVKGKAKNDIVMTVNGEFMSAGDFNSWLKGITGEALFTSHKFRKLLGNVIAVRALEEAKAAVAKARKASKGKPVADKVIHDIFLKAMTEVGKALGHVRGENATPMTAIKSYVSPNLVKAWYSEVGIKPHNSVLTALKSVNDEI